MNTKRQTVWLVSMLSLMVVLSAYYLFTEDVQELDLATGSLSGTEIQVDAVQNAGTAQDAAGKGGESGLAGTSAGAAQGAAGGTAAGDAGKASSDDELLKKVQASAQATSGSDFFTSMQMKRAEEISKQVEKWMAISLDSKKSSAEVEAALAEINNIQDMDAKVTSVEETLQKNYKNAIVLNEGGKWKVIVQAPKLERSEGVSIVDLVMKELGATPDKISVQYIQ
jgi:stage III sporulation protein AH